ncbi:MAG: enoyl-CoA hydratase/isomerase family protein [Xanthobacteraceae bacterium]|jgi:enoyl-CoA hydratase
MIDAAVEYKVSEHVAEICLNRPPVNALSLAMIEELVAALKRAGTDANVRAVLLTSAVPSRFCAGLDLHGLLKSPEQARALLEKLYIELVEAQYALGKPSIAVVNGAARGGGMTLAISCDVIMAGENATFGYPEIDLGLLPAIHFLHLPRVVGRHRAFELLFSGRSFRSDEAVAFGLVSRVVPDDKAEHEARALAQSFARKPPNTMRLGRAAFLRANDRGYRSGIGNAVELFCNIAASADAQEGLRAFVEKRAPRG